MLWFVLSLGTAFFSALEAAVTKRWLGHLSRWDMLACFLGWSWFLFALYIMIHGWQPLPSAYWSNLLFMVPLNMVGTFLQYEAIRAAPLSLTMPFMAFTPVFMIFTGHLFLGELPSVWGVAGMGLIVAGSWVLSAGGNGNRAFWEPFRAIVRERGSRYALAASFIWAVASVISKRLALSGDPVYAGAMFFVIHNALFVTGLLVLRKASAKVLLRHPVAGLASGLVLLAHIACHYSAITMVAAAYMISIKRLNGVMAVVLGRVLFKDPHVRGRLAGAAVMSAGAMVIALWG